MIASLLCLAAVTFATEQEVTFKGADGLELKGTLSLPDGINTAIPGVLFLSGSGPADRNGNQPPSVVTDLQKQIADRLLSAGIASLRFDKRALPGYVARIPKDIRAVNDFFAWEKFVEDAKAALKFLGEQRGVDPQRLIVAGHSEGGMIATQIAADTVGKPEAPAGLILMATPGRTLDHLIREQVRGGLNRSQMSEDAKKPYLDYVEAAIKQIKDKGTVPPNPPIGLGPVFPPSAVKLLKSYFTVDPARLVEHFEGDVLVMQGEKDIRVLAGKDAPLLEAALKKRKKGAVEIFIVPSASHNFKLVGDPNKEVGFTGQVEPAALDKIAVWVARFKP
jgi:acetyl esterase/lipase